MPSIGDLEVKQCSSTEDVHHLGERIVSQLQSQNIYLTAMKWQTRLDY